MIDLHTRAIGYQLLAAGFAYPDAATLGAVCELAGNGPEPVMRMSAALGVEIDGGLDGEYNRLFHQAVAASPYQSDYAATDKGAAMGQLAALMAAFGVRAGGSEHERVDHVGTELCEMAGFLALKEHLCAGDAEHAALARRARQVFLEDHLGTWLDAFCSRLEAVAAHGFYRRLAALAADWVRDDLRDGGWSARPVPALLPVVQDGPMTCPLAGEEVDA